MPDLNPLLDSNSRPLEPVEAAPSPMLVLARSLASGGPLASLASISSLEDECSRLADETINDLAQFSQSFNSDIAFMPNGPARIELRMDPANPFSLIGLARVQIRSCYYEHAFETSGSTISIDAQQAAVRCLLSAHSEFSYGMEEASDLSSLSDEQKSHAEFLAALPQIGRPGILLRDALILEHAWNWPRTSIALDLEKLIREAALDGLIPRGFECSKIVLGGGFPGESTALWVWDAFSDPQSRHSGASILQALDARRPNDDWSWSLPSLDQGAEAIWAALCGHIARAHAGGWQNVPPHFIGSDAADASAAATERLLLSELPEAAPKRRSAL